MRFNLVTVIETTEAIEEDVKKAIAEFHKALGSVGHQVTSATLTGDKGQTNVTPPPVPAEPEPTPHVASTLDS